MNGVKETVLLLYSELIFDLKRIPELLLTFCSVFVQFLLYQSNKCYAKTEGGIVSGCELSEDHVCDI